MSLLDDALLNFQNVSSPAASDELVAAFLVLGEREQATTASLLTQATDLVGDAEFAPIRRAFWVEAESDDAEEAERQWAAVLAHCGEVIETVTRSLALVDLVPDALLDDPEQWRARLHETRIRADNAFAAWLVHLTLLRDVAKFGNVFGAGLL